MKNKIIKITYIFIIFGIVAFNLKLVYAVTETDIKNQISGIDNQIDEAYTEIAGLQEKMTINLEQINRLNLQIKEYEDALEGIDEEIDKANEALEQKKLELEEATSEYNRYKRIVEARLVAMYESSKTTYLDMLVGSSDITDFLSKYYLLKELAEYDSDLLNSLYKSESEVQKETDALAEVSNDIELSKEKYTLKHGGLEVLLRDKNELISILSDEEIAVNEKIEQFEQDKKDLEEELKELVKQNAIKASLTPSECGYISPLLGKTKSNITTGYRGYTGHTGVDFAIPLKTEVLAVKAGTVFISSAFQNSDGTYRSYGEYVVIDHHDGTMTLYAHGTPGSRVVKKDDEVEAGQVIMLSGSTGNSTGPHLHFEVRINGKAVDPTPYLP